MTKRLSRMERAPKFHWDWAETLDGEVWTLYEGRREAPGRRLGVVVSRGGANGWYWREELEQGWQGPERRVATAKRRLGTAAGLVLED